MTHAVGVSPSAAGSVIAEPMKLITSTEELASACARFATQPFVTVDTEFMRVDTYYPKLCLIQLGMAGRVFCVDPLAVPDCAPLAPLLAAAGYDEATITRVQTIVRKEHLEKYDVKSLLDGPGSRLGVQPNLFHQLLRRFGRKVGDSGLQRVQFFRSLFCQP